MDFIVTIGGDGTILYASSLFQTAVPPVISLHMGSLGFLMNFSSEGDKYVRVIEHMLSGDATATLRARLDCEFFSTAEKPKVWLRFTH